eukprot:Hpha_TRINITY_DN29835_c0_g1::TRINITY_DN29835_c0_g1_i1::g.2973::m.2973
MSQEGSPHKRLRAKDLNNRGIVLTPDTSNRLRPVADNELRPGQIAAVRRLRRALRAREQQNGAAAAAGDLDGTDVGRERLGGGATFRVPTLPLSHGVFHYAPRYLPDSGGPNVYLTSKQVAHCKAVFDASGGIGAYDDKKMSRMLRQLGVPAPPAQELAKLMTRADAQWHMSYTPGWVHDLRRGRQRVSATGKIDGSESEEDDDAVALKTQTRRLAWDRLQTYRRLIDAIGGCYALDYLSGENRAKLAESVSNAEWTVDAGAVIIEAMTPGEDAFIVAEGVVLVTAEDDLFQDQGDPTRAKLGRGSLFGAEVLEGKKGVYTSSVLAVTRARLVRLPRQVVRSNAAVMSSLRRVGVMTPERVSRVEE